MPSPGAPPSLGTLLLACRGQVGRHGHAQGWAAMWAAHAAASGRPMGIIDSCRGYAGEVGLHGHKPALAAVPATSNRGWGPAVDPAGGSSLGTAAQYEMTANGAGLGLLHLVWADPGRGCEESWHREYAEG